MFCWSILNWLFYSDSSTYYASFYGPLDQPSKDTRYNRSFYEERLSPIRRNYDHSSSKAANINAYLDSKSPSIDLSSLDAVLDSTLYSDNDMSRSTKEWRSSFSSVRNRFGHIPSVEEQTQINHFTNFTTDGSMSLSHHSGLSKSASQSMVSEHSEHTEYAKLER